MRNKRLINSYSFPGFKPLDKIYGKFGDPKAIIIPTKRIKKKQFV